MKALHFNAKTLVVVFAGSLFLLGSGISSAVKEHHMGEASKTKEQHKPAVMEKLDGKIFAVRLMEPGKPPMRDSLIFRSGSFKSSACAAFGFGKGNYKTQGADSTLTFTAKTVSPSEGTMLWKGSIRGNQVQGTVEWTKKNQAEPAQMTFSGSQLEPQTKTEVSPK